LSKSDRGKRALEEHRKIALYTYGTKTPFFLYTFFREKRKKASVVTSWVQPKPKLYVYFKLLKGQPCREIHLHLLVVGEGKTTTLS